MAKQKTKKSLKYVLSLRLWLESGNPWQRCRCTESPIVCTGDQLSVLLVITSDASESPHADTNDLSSIMSGSIRQKWKELKSSALSGFDVLSDCTASDTVPSHLQAIPSHPNYTCYLHIYTNYHHTYEQYFYTHNKYTTFKAAIHTSLSDTVCYHHVHCYSIIRPICFWKMTSDELVMPSVLWKQMINSHHIISWLAARRVLSCRQWMVNNTTMVRQLQAGQWRVSKRRYKCTKWLKCSQPNLQHVITVNSIIT